MPHTVRIKDPKVTKVVDETEVTEREFTKKVSYAHVSDDQMAEILAERGVKVPRGAKRAKMVDLMMGSEPGAHRVELSDDR